MKTQTGTGAGRHDDPLGCITLGAICLLVAIGGCAFLSLVVQKALDLLGWLWQAMYSYPAQSFSFVLIGIILEYIRRRNED